MKVTCHTNLDLFNELWPSVLPCRPMKGDYIQSMTKHRCSNDHAHYFSLELEVVGITFKQNQNGFYCYVELHDKSFYKRSISDFYKWYAPLVGKSKHYFI